MKHLFLLLAIIINCNLSYGQYWDQNKVTSQERFEGNNFGESVYIDDDYTIISAPGGGTESEKIGRVYVYSNTNPLILLDEINFIETTTSVENNSRFGSKVTRYGDYIFVGISNFDYNSTSNTGAIYVYKKESTSSTWELHQEIYPNTIQEDLYYGSRFEVQDDFLIVGAHYENKDDTTLRSGAAYIYVLDNDNWIFEKKLLPDNPQPNMQFGASISIDNKRCAIGAPNSSINDLEFMGNVFLYEQQDNNLGDTDWYLIKTFNGPVIGASNRGFNFGLSVQLNGDRLIVGAPAESTLQSDLDYQGKTYIIEYDATSDVWNLEHVLTASDGYDGNKFGYKVVVDGDFLLIKGSNESEAIHSGKVYLYQYDGAEWVENRKFVSMNNSEYDGFGFDFSINDSTIIIGDSWDEHDSEGNNFLANSGAVYIINSTTINSINQNIKLIDIILYPNPAQNYIVVKNFDSVKDAIFSITSIDGKQFLTNQKIVDSKIDVSNLPIGIYQLNIQLDNQKSGFPFIKN